MTAIITHDRLKVLRSTKALLSFVIALMVFCTVFLGYTIRSIDFFTKVPGDLGDARFNSVILEHVYLWMAGKQASLWNPGFFYPYEHMLAFSDNHFGSAIFYAPFRVLGFSRESAFDLWYLTGVVLNFFACFIVLKKLKFESFPAAIGAYVFTFALPALAQDGHAQLTYRFAAPFAYLALLQAYEQRRLLLLVNVAAWTTLQFYCSIYLGVFLAFVLCATVLAIFILDNGSFVPALRTIFSKATSRQKWLTAIGITVCAATLLWLLGNYALTSHLYGIKRKWSEIESMLPRLGSYFLADGNPLISWVGSWVQGIPMRHEHQMFVGFGVLAIILFGIASLFSTSSKHTWRLGVVSVIGVAVVCAVTLDIGGFSFYRIITWLPGTNAIRAVTRVIVLLLLPMAVLSAIGAEYIVRLANSARPVIGRVATLVPVVLLGVISIETITYRGGSTPVSAWRERQNILASRLPSVINRGSVLWFRGELQEPNERLFIPLDAMIVAQDLQLATVNGYSGSAPAGSGNQFSCLSPHDLLDAWAEVARVPQTEVLAQLPHIIAVDLTPCDNVILRSKAIDPTVVPTLSLSVSEVKLEATRGSALVHLKNGSSARLDAIAKNGKNLRLSWRMVPVSPDGVRISEPAWDTRLEINASIEPGGAIDRRIAFIGPEQPGNYILEVSLVEELEKWFHDYGLVPAAVRITKIDGGTGVGPVSLAGSNTIDFRRSAWPGIIAKATGLSSAEQWGTWSLGGAVALEFSTPLPDRFTVHLLAHAFGPNIEKEFIARVGDSTAKFMLGTSLEERVLEFSNPGRSKTMEVDIPSPASPKSLGQSGDERELGIAFTELRIMPL